MNVKVFAMLSCQLLTLTGCLTTYFVKDGPMTPEPKMEKTVEYAFGLNSSDPVVIKAQCDRADFSKVRIERGFWTWNVDVNCK